MEINRELLDLLVVHLIFAVIASTALLLPINVVVGWRLLAVVISYNVLIPTFARFKGHNDWMNIWTYSLILSIFQVFPDWYLSAQLNVLVFPIDGSPMIGTVPLYMAGLWAIPLFIIVSVGRYVESKQGNTRAYLSVVLFSLVTFITAEATLWMLPSWYAQNVFKIGHVALYIIIPEALLGWSTYVVYQMLTERPWWYRVHWAWIVMIFYVGTSSFFYFLVERVILSA